MQNIYFSKHAAIVYLWWP